MNLRELGEDRLVQLITNNLTRNSSVVVGPGDDCAIVRIASADQLGVLKTDCIVGGVHFTVDAAATDIGWKAMARPLSDFAAMSALPRSALITLIAPVTTSAAWVRNLYRGMTKAADAFGVVIVGGETSRTSGPIAISVSIVGVVEPDRFVRRSGGKEGDDLFVTGRLGGSLGGRHLKFTPRIHESRWLTSNARVRAMMDLSDGLGADLPRLAHASGVGFEVDQQSLPRHRGCSVEQAIGDGEDYELLFAIAPGESDELQRRWRKKFPSLPLTRIGRFTGKSKTGNRNFPPGYVHFR